MKIFIVTGEASGDLHASLLVESLYKKYPDADIQGWGGDLMESKGVKVLKHIRDLAFMGFIEVAKHLPEILRNFKICKNQIQEFDPDLVILVDYPGFNLRLLPWLKENNHVFSYYISPQVWAWKEARVQKIKKYVDQMICILPFEKDFYAKHDYEVQYIGHPLVQVTPRYEAKYAPDMHRYIALLPGSRLQEVENNLEEMIKGCEQYREDFQIAIAKSPNLESEVYADLLDKYPFVKLFKEGSYELLSQSYVALVASGTATLETALFHVPQIVCYRSNPISVWLARRLIRVPYISLVNLIMGEELIPELIQKEFTAHKIKEILPKLMDKANPYRKKMVEGYQELKSKLWEGEKPTDKAVGYISEYLEKK